MTHLDLAFPTLRFFSLGDFGMDAMDLQAQHVLDFNVLSLVDSDDMAITDDDFKALNDCLFDSHLVLSTPQITVAEPSCPPAPRVAKRYLYQPRKSQQLKQPPAKRQRDRKRTPQQRESENKTRKANVHRHNEDRNACIEREGDIRDRVRQCIAAVANSVGLPADARVLSYLPAELRYIMWRSDVAMEAYTQFTGWSKLCQSVNGLGNWW